MTNEELWQTVLAQIQLNLSQANFSTWFKNTEISSCKEGIVLISVPNSFVKEWLENKYNKTILKILHNLNSEIKEIKYIIGKNNRKNIFKEINFDAATEQLEFSKLDKETNLNPKYQFESFVVGPFNELAHAAAYAVAEKPGLVYNPLFIYGGVGLGKTHLLQAVGNKLKENSSTKKIRYISSEKFTSEVVGAIKNNKAEEFKSKYKAIDLLIIDDVQFLAGREKTQEQFFHIFNVLYEKNKQIIISSDRPPKAIQSLAERLKSRFEGGMLADISVPDYETRIAILKTKAQEKTIDFPEEVYQYIASVIKKNIRELEGALNRLIMSQKINNQRITEEIAKDVLKNISVPSNIILNPKKIIQSVAEFYDLKERDLLVCSRKKEIVKPRQMAMYLLRTELKCSFPFIGRKFNGKDHTTVIYSFKKISEELEKNKRLEEELTFLKEKIYNG